MCPNDLKINSLGSRWHLRISSIHRTTTKDRFEGVQFLVSGCSNQFLLVLHSSQDFAETILADEAVKSGRIRLRATNCGATHWTTICHDPLLRYLTNNQLIFNQVNQLYAFGCVMLFQNSFASRLVSCELSIWTPIGFKRWIEMIYFRWKSWSYWPFCSCCSFSLSSGRSLSP